MNVSHQDREILRALAGRVREIAGLPEMADRKARWYRHNALRQERPMVLCFPEGAWAEILPDESLQCSHPVLRQWEHRLRQIILWWEIIRDDNVVEPFFDLSWQVSIGDYGVQTPHIHPHGRGSYTWDPPLKDLREDFKKLRFRELSVDREATRRKQELATELFGDLLPPRLHYDYWWTMGLTLEAAKLVGLETLMMLPYDDPEFLHMLLGWLRDEHLHFMAWFEREGLLISNNKNHYTGSGGVGYTTELNAPESEEHGAALEQMWGFSESQETVGMSPSMFGEFIFPYQLPLLQRFGLNCYGCCEPVHDRWEHIRKIPRLRRVSVSPWCDEEIMAEGLGENVIFSRKPNPAPLSVGFDEKTLRRDLRRTLDAARGCNLEIIMKDTHTVQNDPSRITRWVQMAYEEIER